MAVKATLCASNMVSISKRARKWRKAFLRPLSASLLNDLISNCQRMNILKDLAHYSGSKLHFKDGKLIFLMYYFSPFLYSIPPSCSGRELFIECGRLLQMGERNISKFHE